jgi:hypothetical protein
MPDMFLLNKSAIRCVKRSVANGGLPIQQRLYFLPLPQGQGSFLPTLFNAHHLETSLRTDLEAAGESADDLHLISDEESPDARHGEAKKELTESARRAAHIAHRTAFHESEDIKGLRSRHSHAGPIPPPRGGATLDRLISYPPRDLTLFLASP